MKQFLTFMLLMALCHSVNAQKEGKESGSNLGLKFGYNWSYVTVNTAGFSPDNKSGFMAGVFFSPSQKKGFGFRSEIVFSRQGYSFDNGGSNTAVLNDYLYLPQMTTFNITKLLQLQAGAQIGYLLNSKLVRDKDSTITDLMNRIDYGFAAGVELNPVKGLLLGARYNLGLGKLNKQFEASASNPYPLPFNPETTNLKNGVVQFFVGYRF